METGRLLIALLLTWLPGCLWLMRIVAPGSPGRASMVAGYGLLAGLVVVPLIMRGLSAAGVPFSLVSIALPMVGLLLAAVLAPGHWRLYAAAPGPVGTLPDNTRWETLIIVLCAALILTRLLTLGLEVGTRPVFAWDAKQHWAKLAKVFFDMGAVVPYVPFQEWLAAGGRDVFTTVHPDYPVTIPLLQVWTTTALDRWHESLINLPWILCYLALGLIFYGQVLAAGARTAVAVASTYMLLSLPYLNIQVALAGYADIFMASCYLAAVAAFYNWSLHGDKGQGLLAACFAFACMLIKNEGLFWLSSFVPGLLLVWLGARKGFVLICVLLLMLLLVLWLLPGDLTVAGQSMNNIDLRYRPASWPAIFQSLLVHDNWHLLGYVTVAMVLAVFVFASPSLPGIMPPATTVVSAFCLYLALYLLTRHAVGAVQFTSINRVGLQLMPAVGFLATLIYLQLAREQDSRQVP